jgi:hypothetical protein
VNRAALSLELNHSGGSNSTDAALAEASTIESMRRDRNFPIWVTSRGGVAREWFGSGGRRLYA